MLRDSSQYREEASPRCKRAEGGSSWSHGVAKGGGKSAVEEEWKSILCWKCSRSKLAVLAAEKGNERAETDVKKSLVECEGREEREISYLEDYCIPARRGFGLFRIFTRDNSGQRYRAVDERGKRW